MNEKIDEMLRWYFHVKRMGDSCLVNQICSGEFVGNRLAGRPKKKKIDFTEKCLNVRNVNLFQAKRMMQNRSKCRDFVRGYNCQLSLRDELHDDKILVKIQRSVVKP